MLSAEEKLKFKWKSSTEVRSHKKFQSKSKIDLIETMIKILKGLAIIAGI